MPVCRYSHDQSQAQIGAMRAPGFPTRWDRTTGSTSGLWGEKRMIQCQRNGWNKIFSGCVSGCAGVVASVIIVEVSAVVWLSSETRSCCQSWRALRRWPGWPFNLTQFILRLFCSAWKQRCLTVTSSHCDANTPTVLLLSLQQGNVSVLSWYPTTAPETAFGPSCDTTVHLSETGLIPFVNAGWHTWLLTVRHSCVSQYCFYYQQWKTKWESQKDKRTYFWKIQTIRLSRVWEVEVCASGLADELKPGFHSGF